MQPHQSPTDCAGSIRDKLHLRSFSDEDTAGALRQEHAPNSLGASSEGRFTRTNVLSAEGKAGSIAAWVEFCRSVIYSDDQNYIRSV